MIAGRGLVIAAALVAAAHVAILTSMIAGRAAILRSGTEIVLQVEPVDPRDLLRGDYVVLSYNVSRIDLSLFEVAPPRDSEAGGRTVFVRLAPDGDGIWQPVVASLDGRPAAAIADGQVDIRGESQGGLWEQSTHLGVFYGIERFYVPEGEGRPIEENLNTRAFTMRVAVASDGTAQIKSFHDGDTLLFEEALY